MASLEPIPSAACAVAQAKRGRAQGSSHRLSGGRPGAGCSYEDGVHDGGGDRVKFLEGRPGERLLIDEAVVGAEPLL